VQDFIANVVQNVCSQYIVIMIIVVMGVSGSGKTTVGKALAFALEILMRTIFTRKQILRK